MTILIAEDDEHLRTGLIDLLTLEGYACVGVADDPKRSMSFVARRRTCVSSTW